MGTGRFSTILILSAAVLACGGGTDDGRLRVAVSVVPQAWLVETIAGPHANVVVLVGPGESPATYQPSDLQVTEVMRSRVYFRIGVPFENGKWLGAIRSSSDVRIVDAREGIPLREMAGHHHDGHAHEEGDEAEAKDPHVWLAPGPLETQARTVAETLAELDPDHADEFRDNLKSVVSEIDRADAEIRLLLDPHRGRRFYVFHPAWGYFCDAYGLEQVAIEAEGKEPSESELTGLLANAKRDGVKVVFVQSQITGTTARAVADTIGAKLVAIDPLARPVPENLLEVARIFAESLR